MMKTAKVHPARTVTTTPHTNKLFWSIDMLGTWVSNADVDKHEYYFRMILKDGPHGEVLWAGTKDDKPFANRFAHDLPDDHVSRLMSVSPGDRGDVNGGNLGFNTPNQLLSKDPVGLVGDEITIGGIIQWYVSGNSNPEYMAQLKKHAQVLGKDPRKITSERAFEFVSGLYSPSSERMVFAGTHMSNSGKGVIGLGLYDLRLEAGRKKATGNSQNLQGIFSPIMTAESIETAASQFNDLDFSDLKARDNEELVAFAAAAAAIAKIRDDKGRTKVREHQQLMFEYAVNFPNSEKKDQMMQEFQVLKEIAREQSLRLGNLIEACMAKYRTVSERYKFVDSVISTTDVYHQQKPPDIAGEDPARQLRALLAIAMYEEPPFRKQIKKLVQCLNRAASDEDEQYDLSGFCRDYNLDATLFPFELSSCVKIPGREKVVVGKFGPPKGFDRALIKLGLGKELEDLNRVTLVCEDPYVMGLVFKALQSQSKIVCVKNKFKQVSGWEQPPDLHLILDINGRGWLVEVQLLFHDILAVKKEMHRYYNIERAPSPLEILKPLYKLDLGTGDDCE
jgi:hypothetical protein